MSVVVEVQTLSKRMQKEAYVEVLCALPHDTAYYNGSYHCRYARGNVEHKDSGLVIEEHDCHLCAGYRLMKATTNPEDQKCNNCWGPVKPSGESSSFPDLLIVDNFVEPRE